MDPVISVITIVKNDRGIADTLAALRKQEKPAPTEIVVVDASSSAALADIRARYPDVRWREFVSATPATGKATIPEQRNIGVGLAKGKIIVFIDANCVPSEHWLVEITKPILEGRETMAAGSVRASDPRAYVNTNPENDKNNGYLPSSGTGNLAFLKEVWTKAGGFDESFSFGSDVDFTWRCVKAGNRILFVRHAYVVHDWGTFGDEVRRSFRYGKARAAVLKKHPELFKELLGPNLYIFAYTVYLLGLPLTFWLPWYPLLIVIAIAKNIGNHPFKTVFMNLVYTLGTWFGFLEMYSRTIFSNAAASSVRNRL